MTDNIAAAKGEKTMTLQFDIKRMDLLKDILRRLRHGVTPELLQTIENHFSDVSHVDFL